MKKKKHWTQTPAGRKHMSAIQKKRFNEKKETKEEVQESICAFACGYIKAWLEQYAERLSVPSSPLTARVAQFLHKSSRR